MVGIERCRGPRTCAVGPQLGGPWPVTLTSHQHIKPTLESFSLVSVTWSGLLRVRTAADRQKTQGVYRLKLMNDLVNIGI